MNNGPQLFTTLEAAVDEYNDKCSSQGGKALLQKFERFTDSFEMSDDDTDNSVSPPKTRKER